MAPSSPSPFWTHKDRIEFFHLCKLAKAAGRNLEWRIHEQGRRLSFVLYDQCAGQDFRRLDDVRRHLGVLIGAEHG
jgi:hypothetical protein